MCFLTLLATESAPIMAALIEAAVNAAAATVGAAATGGLAGGSRRGGPHPALLLRAPPEPAGGRHVLFEQFWVEAGPLEPRDPAVDEQVGGFVLTPSARGHLANLARAVLLRRFPVLLQGPTASGKTSLVEYLAARTGHRFVRLNNHEHTDLQEYLGAYGPGPDGRLAFQEGALVRAVRVSRRGECRFLF